MTTIVNMHRGVIGGMLTAVLFLAFGITAAEASGHAQVSVSPDLVLRYSDVTISYTISTGTVTDRVVIHDPFGIEIYSEPTFGALSGSFLYSADDPAGLYTVMFYSDYAMSGENVAQDTFTIVEPDLIPDPTISVSNLSNPGNPISIGDTIQVSGSFHENSTGVSVFGYIDNEISYYYPANPAITGVLFTESRDCTTGCSLPWSDTDGPQAVADPFPMHGTVNIQYCLDTNNMVLESDEGNNCVNSSLTVSGPDLDITSLSASEPLYAGRDVTVSAITENIGNAETVISGASFDVRFRVYYESNNVLVFSSSVQNQGSVVNGTTFQKDHTFTLEPGRAENIVVEYCVDINDDINNESSGALAALNCRTQTFTVTLPPPPVVTMRACVIDLGVPQPLADPLSCVDTFETLYISDTDSVGIQWESGSDSDVTCELTSAPTDISYDQVGAAYRGSDISATEPSSGNTTRYYALCSESGGHEPPATSVWVEVMNVTGVPRPCDNGSDDDGDNLADFDEDSSPLPRDPGCVDANDYSEENEWGDAFLSPDRVRVTHYDPSITISCDTGIYPAHLCSISGPGVTQACGAVTALDTITPQQLTFDVSSDSTFSLSCLGTEVDSKQIRITPRISE